MENKQLEKSLGVAAALSTVVGMVIGGGVFFKPQAARMLSVSGNMKRRIGKSRSESTA